MSRARSAGRYHSPSAQAGRRARHGEPDDGDGPVEHVGVARSPRLRARPVPVVHRLRDWTSPYGAAGPHAKTNLLMLELATPETDGWTVSVFEVKVEPPLH